MDNPEQHPSSQEMAALELYHQLVNLSPDHGDNALMLTLRLPNGRYVGDIWLSTQDVQWLADGAMAICVQRGLEDEAEQAAGPLPVDEDDDEAIAAFVSRIEEFLENGGTA